LIPLEKLSDLIIDNCVVKNIDYSDIDFDNYFDIHQYRIKNNYIELINSCDSISTKYELLKELNSICSNRNLDISLTI